jgi:translocation and assembly module TamB
VAAIADPQPRPPPATGRVRRILRALGVTIGLTTVFLTSLAGSVVLHLDLRPTRRVVRKVANQALLSLFEVGVIDNGPERVHTTFHGRLEVGAIDRLSLHGLSFRDVKAFDPRGTQVIHAAGLRADADVLAIARSAVLGSGDLLVTLQLVHLDHADVSLERGPSGLPTIAEIFVSQQPPTPPTPGARKVRFSIEKIELGHVWAHGGLVPPALDAELSSTTGSFKVGPDGMWLDVDHAEIVARAPVPRPLSGAAEVHLKQAAEGAMEVSGDFSGQLGDIAAHATAQMEGTHLRGRVELPHVTAAAVAALVPGEPPTIPLRVPVAAVV